MGIGVKTRPKILEAASVNSIRTGVNTAVSGSVDNINKSGFTTEDKVSSSVKSNGLSYSAANNKEMKASVETADGSRSSGSSISASSEEEYQAQANSGMSKANDAKNQASDGQASSMSLMNQGNAYDRAMKSSAANMDAGTNLIGNKTDEMNKCGKTINTCTNKQQEICSWLEKTEPTVEAMDAQIASLMKEALQTIPEELGISPDTPLDEAMSILNEMIDPDKLEELNQQQIRSEEIQQEMDTLNPEDENDAKKLQELGDEQDAIQTVLTDPDNKIMLQASEALAKLADYADAISAIEEAKNNVQIQIDAKYQESDDLDTEVNTQVKKSDKAMKVSTSTFQQAEKENDDDIEESDKFMEATQVVHTVGMVVGIVGSVVYGVGQILSMCPMPPVAAVGTIILGIGLGVQGTGQVIDGVATVCDGIHTEDAGMIVAGFTGISAGIVQGVKGGTQVAEGAKDYKESKPPKKT